MKKNVFTIGLMILAVAGLGTSHKSANALSFMQGTIFLEANTKVACDALGGAFTEWYGETYCTKEPMVTRAEFLKMALQMAGGDQIQCRRLFNYPDADFSADYGDALQAASCRGIVAGNPDGSFQPNQAINFAEAAKIAVLAFELPMTREAYPNWYGNYTSTLERLGATPNTNMTPDQNLNFSDMMMILNTLNPNEAKNDSDYIGMTIEEAQTLAAENDVLFRVVEGDGQFLPVTMDYRPGRINAAVENEIVISYSVEGQETGMTEENSVPVTRTVTVAPELVECTGVGPMECMIVDGEYFYDQIEGFEFEAGYEYVLEIKVSDAPEPVPADASSKRYELIDIISKVPAE